MQQAELNVVSRSAGNNVSNQDLRSKGFIPANIYGPGLKNEVCAFSEKELRKAVRNDFESNFVFNLQSPDKNLNGKKVVLKALDRDPATWSLIHADLYEVQMDRPINVSVPIHFLGLPEGVKNEGGIQQAIRRNVRIRALLADIPEFVEADVSHLHINEALHIKDVKFSDKIEVLDSGDFTLLAIIEPEKEEVVAVVATAEGVATAAGTGTAAAAGTGAAAAAGTAAPAAGAAPTGDKGGDKKPPAKK